MCACKYQFICVSHTTWQVMIICDFGGFKKERKSAWWWGRRRVFSNQSHCRFVVTCSQTDKVAFPDCSHPHLSYLTPKNTATGKQGDEAPQPYPGKEMASYQIRLGSLFYGVNLDRGDKEMTHPLRTQREKEISPPAAYMALVQPDRQRIERS